MGPTPARSLRGLLARAVGLALCAAAGVAIAALLSGSFDETELTRLRELAHGPGP